MPTHFLDLDDDILIHIAHYIQPDRGIPIPSFGPHWENFAPDIGESHNSDMLSLRATCTRLCGIIRLEGLHVRLTSYEQLEAWLFWGPSAILKGVRRLEIDLPDDELSLSSTWNTWSGISRLLNEMTSLQEVIIQSLLHLCTHTIAGPLDLFLNLDALSIQVKCASCADVLPRLLVPQAPNIRSLKMCVSTSNQPSNNGSASSSIDDLCEAWKTRWPTRQIPLETVFLRVPYAKKTVETVIGSCSSLPQLRNVSIIPFVETSMICDYVMFPWNSVTCKAIYNVETNQYEAIRQPSWEKTLRSKMSSLKSLPKLESLDCFLSFMVTLEGSLKRFGDKSRTESRSEFQSRLDSREQDEVRWRAQMMAAEAAVKSLLLRLIEEQLASAVYLKTGAIWEQSIVAQ
ncbi:hypothetical protein CI109_104172 [Kwoniella shandongensis]|uniref:Uncharacterized protein n=1 Tax=Kwoniella shandongensis TaxID=1734106 RepID=A0A5M6C0T8_9TREE|nr:uncharacterized protein CI109_002916 [Kwoniella shandongensis]KAA5528758.1 hypothetical protein CI109_002916 [Kwoniella shandongensis]